MPGMHWWGYAWQRARAALGLAATLVALVAVTTGVLAGVVGMSTAAASDAARAAVEGEGQQLTARTRLASDVPAQTALGTELIEETFAPAPVVVDTSTDEEFLTFHVSADPERLSPDDLPAYAEGATALRQVLRTSDVNVNGVTTEGDLAGPAAEASRSIAMARALGLVPISVLALVTVLAVAQVARLLTTARERSTSLLVARGTSARQVFALDAGEASVIVALGGVLGTGLAAGVVAALGHAAHIPTVLLTGAAVAGFTWLLVLGMLLVQLRAAMRPGFDADRSGRAASAVAGVTVALVLVLAGVALWQLRRTGSPLDERDGVPVVNVVAGAAPALLLAAVGVVAMGLLGPIGLAVQAAARAGRDATRFLASAQVSRRIRMFAVPVVLTVLASGATTLAGLYSGTSSQLREDVAAVSVAAPIRVVEPADPNLEVDGVTTARVWTSENASIGDRTVTALAAVPDELAAVVDRPDGPTLVPDALLTPADNGTAIDVPDDAGHVTVELTATLPADRWSLAELEAQDEILSAYQEVFAGLDPAAEAAVEERRSVVARRVESLGSPFELGVSFVLRDRSGAVRTEPVGTLTAQGPSFTYDEASLSGFSGQDGAPVTDSWDIEVPAGTAIEGVQFTTTPPEQGVLNLREWTAELRITTPDGEDLLGDATASWASPEATDPTSGAQLWDEYDTATPEFGYRSAHQDNGGGYFEEQNNRPFIRALLDTSGPTWTVRSMTDHDGFLGTTVSATSSPGAAAMEGPAGVPKPLSGVRVSVTRALATAAGLSEGQEFELQVINRHVTATVAAVVDAVPGVEDAQALLVDWGTLAPAFASAPPKPAEVWATADDVPAAAAALEPMGGSVVVEEATELTDPTRSARRLFLVTCAGAMLLAATGIAVASAQLTRERRAEVAVLRAVGMPTSGQATSRVLELAGVVAASLVLGVAGGWAVGALVVPPLAQATAVAGQITVEPRLTMQWLVWALTLTAGAVAVAFVCARLWLRVRREALDDEYREEVR